MQAEPKIKQSVKINEGGLRSYEKLSHLLLCLQQRVPQTP